MESPEARTGASSEVGGTCSPEVSFDSSNFFNTENSSMESNAISTRTTPSATLSKIGFNYSSLVLKNNPPWSDPSDKSYSARSEEDFDSASYSLEVPTFHDCLSRVTFDHSSLLQDLSSSSSDNELTSTELTNPLDSTDQHVNSNVTLDSGFQATDDGSMSKRNTRLPSILKYQKPLSSIEQVVADCLKLLCETDDRHQSRELIRSSVSEVFKGLCFDQFFRKGECFSSYCDDKHHYKSHIFSHSKEDLWNASLYVIRHTAIPNRQIVENLVQHYTAKENSIRALLFAKCIAKMKESDRLELANFIVNKLSDALPTRDAITIILMLNFSELPSKQFNVLMEGLRVFEQNTINYSELMIFLNFHGHQMPASFLNKLMKDSMKYAGKMDMVESIAGFLRRLDPIQKHEVRPTADDFIERFRVLPYYSDYEPPDKKSKMLAKKVEFAVELEVREFDATDYHRDLDDEIDNLEGDFSDEDNEDKALPGTSNFYGSSALQSERIARVFGESCGTWMLNGHCSNKVCPLTHGFSKDSLAGLSSEDVYLATDFILSQSVSPSFEILKVFVEFLAESKAGTLILKLRNRTTKLTQQDGLKLTKLVFSSLEKQLGRWEAIEKLLVPNILELDDVEDHQQFTFDSGLLCCIMNEAIESKTTVMRCVSRAIMQLASNLLSRENAELLNTASTYIKTFVVTEREWPSTTDIPCVRIELNSFTSHLKVALYQGAPSKYFLATIMTKQAINTSLQDQAVDVLYTFLLSNFDRARVLTLLLENCNYFNAKNQRSMVEVLGIVGINTAVRLFENENLAGAAELFVVLRNFSVNIFTLPASHGNTSEFNLAIIYCSVTTDTIDRNNSIDVFLNRVMDSFLESASTQCPPELIKLTAKMFRVFTTALMVEESLKLYKGIIDRQKSLVSPLNILQFVEATFRCTLHRSIDQIVRKEILRLYNNVIECETPMTFQKVTLRSLFLMTLEEITSASLISRDKGFINLLHPHMKKMLIKCIKEGGYHEMKKPQITIPSSITAEEMRVYLLWWFALYIRARKREAIDYFSPVTINIIRESIQDDYRLPVHHSLRCVNVSITDSVERLASVIKNLIGVPLSFMASRGRGVVELHPFTVQALSQTALNLMLQHGYIKAEKYRLCTWCFDKFQVDLENNL